MINGSVFNNGGSITYANESYRTDLYVRNLTQTNSSIVETLISANISTTVIRGGTVQMGGIITVTLGSLVNITTTGILLIEAEDELSGDTPTLQLKFENGTVVTIGPSQSPSCGYSLRRQAKSLFLVFDLGCSISAPTQTQVLEDSRSNVGAIAGGVVGGVLGVIVVAIVAVAAIPPLRRRVRPFFGRAGGEPEDAINEEELAPTDSGTPSKWKPANSPPES